MINVRGNLAIRIIPGRLGEFRVGKLLSEVGEFAIKSKLIEELDEGNYAGTFTVRKIYPSSFSAGGRITLEVRADLEEMLLDEVLDAVPPQEPVEPDPIEEECTIPLTPVEGAPADQPAHSSALPEPTPSSDSGATDEDPVMAQLFGTLWPLEASVRLDPTIGRDVLRKQVTALKQLGFTYAPTEQVWSRK